jgi:outer membrane protein assembly factor BamB
MSTALLRTQESQTRFDPVPLEEPFARQSVSLARWLALLALGALAACGGGGDGGQGGSGGPATGGGGTQSGSSGTQPLIQAVLLSFPINGAPPGFVSGTNNSGVTVTVKDATGASPITNATVTVNGMALTYSSQVQGYEGQLNIAPAAQVTFAVTVAGVAYSATLQQFGTFPTITVPTPNTNWWFNAPNLVSWSGVTPDSGSIYALGVLDTNGALLWPSGGSLQTVTAPQSNFTIPATSVSVGSRLVLVGIIDAVQVPGAAPGSGAIVGAFNFSPVTVTQTSQTLSSVAVQPGTATVGIGKTLQLAAVGKYTDSSTQDVTARATWSSSDTTKVTVNSTGVITGVAPGVVTVTAQVDGITSSASSVTVFQPDPSPTPPLTQAVAVQIDYAHSGRATVGGAGPTFPPGTPWEATFSAPVSYPLIADGKVFVIVNNNSLYALDETNGNIVWGPVALNPGFIAHTAHAFDHGKIFVINFDGLLSSFDAATGTPGWSAKMPYQYSFTAAPTAVNGIVYVGGAGSGGTVFGVDERTGSVLWNAQVENGDESSPTVSSDGVFFSYPCQAYKFDPISGQPLWHYSGPCEGGGGTTSVFANDKLFDRDPESNIGTSAPPGLIFDAGTGKQVSTFNADRMPAFSDHAGFFMSNGTLTAVDQTTNSPVWTFAGDGQLTSAPIVIDSVVVVASASGKVYALNANTGSVVWSGMAGDQINYNVEQGGLAAGDGYLVVPAGKTITGWRLIP